jgi:predicted RNA-binding Zn-ribbon protein involved in translation (DUF1610 family)
MNNLKRKAGSRELQSGALAQQSGALAPTTERIVYCPNCGSNMIKRKSRPGLKSNFWYGCSSFPNCRSIILDINLKDKYFKNNKL